MAMSDLARILADDTPNVKVRSISGEVVLVERN